MQRANYNSIRQRASKETPELLTSHSLYAIMKAQNAGNMVNMKRFTTSSRQFGLVHYGSSTASPDVNTKENYERLAHILQERLGNDLAKLKHDWFVANKANDYQYSPQTTSLLPSLCNRAIS